MPCATPCSQVQDIIKSLDVDNNGQIEWKEFAGLMADRWLRSEGDTDMALALGLLASSSNEARSIDDSDDDIDVERMKDLMCRHGEAPFSAAEWDDFISLADPGKTGRVSASSFKMLPCWAPIQDLPATGNTPRH